MIEGKDYKIENGYLHLSEGKTIIWDFEFKNRNLIGVSFPKGLEKIKQQAFSDNELTSIEIPEGVIDISADAFANNKLITVKLPSTLVNIGPNAFANNKLTNIKISENVKIIREGCFCDNYLKCVEIPSNVMIIEPFAFDNIDVIYNGVLIPKKIVEEYGCENIIKLYEANKIISLEKIYKNISKDVLYVLPITNDDLKGYILNKKHFAEIIGDKEINNEEYQDIFKMCFTLGLFSKPSEELKQFIKQILNENDMDYIHQMWTAVKLTIYKPKFKELFIKLYKDGNIEYNGQNIIGRVYSSFEKLKDCTIKRHEELISKKNTKIKRLKELGANTTLLEQELENLKKNKKTITYDDIVYYIKNNVFEISKGNEALASVISELSIHMEQSGFDEIQYIYEGSKGIEKSIPLTIDSGGHEFRYHWSSSDNPINTILGYVVGCCAKLGGVGEDIMRQSMINPDIVNLILYDENNNIIGKATAYYNRKKKYILFNNVEAKPITAHGLKSAEARQKECLEALIRGVTDVVKALKERGEDISEVRAGMLRNDLAHAIKDYGLEISYDLLEAYNWKGYSGDASDVDSGQAIIYKDDDILKKEEVVNLS